MFKITVTSTRPNTTVAFFSRSNELNVLMTTLQVAGKCLRETRSTNNNGLTFVYESFWASENDYNEYRALKIVSDYNSSKDTYNNTNQIISSVTKELLS